MHRCFCLKIDIKFNFIDLGIDLERLAMVSKERLSKSELTSKSGEHPKISKVLLKHVGVHFGLKGKKLMSALKIKKKQREVF